MDVLTRENTAGRRAAIVASACASISLACVAGCMLLGAPRAKTFGFDHRLHVGEQGLECINCHQEARRSDDPGMPEPEACEVCHEEIDAEKGPESRVARLFDGETFRALHAAKLADENVFSHARHVAAGVECSACHADVAEGERVTADMRLSMDDCVGCHARRGVAGECATCHREIDADWAPASHADHWMRAHGRVVRGGCERTDEDCGLCHSESTCVACHKVLPPENHDVHWRLRGHGVVARIDRESCAACHARDSCERCHAETPPQSHVGSFGAPLATHCFSCHFPLRGEGCVVCHQDTRSHRLAAPKPDDPFHARGMDCRQCHGVGAPLPHVDNGDDCNACHH